MAHCCWEEANKVCLYHKIVMPYKQCPNDCGCEMEIETRVVDDYYIPGFGHREVEENVWVCPECGYEEDVDLEDNSEVL